MPSRYSVEAFGRFASRQGNKDEDDVSAIERCGQQEVESREAGKCSFQLIGSMLLEHRELQCESDTNSQTIKVGRPEELHPSW